MNTLKSLLIFLAVLVSSSPLHAQDRTTTGKFIIEPSTLICLGFEWYISGDANRNASVAVQYREKGANEWKNTLPLLRIGNEKAGTPEWQYSTENMFAGSILDLAPNTAYECKFVLTDPDGTEGVTEIVRDVRTRKEPLPYEEGDVRHVYPKDWEGERIEPSYDGLLHAYYGYPRFADWILTTDPVVAGDKIIVHAGEYKADYKNYRDFHGLTFDGTYFLTQDGTALRPIVIQAAGDGEVVFDGNGNGVLFDVTAADYHYFEGISFRNTEVAIRAGLMNAYGSSGLTVKHCSFLDIGIGIQGQFEGSRHFYIADNTFIGREDRDIVYHSRLENGKSTQRIKSYYAVKVHGQGHTVCYNSVAYFFDGIDICTHARPEKDTEMKAVAIDFYNNELFLCNDNFIEADGGNHNIRVLRNRGINSGQQALSNQPVLGGPVYWIRNVVYNSGNASTFKFWGMFPAGMLMYHNTSSGIFTRDDKPGSNVHARNNLFLPSDDADLPTLGLYTYTGYSSLDYNGYRKRDPFIGYFGPQAGQLYDFSEGNSAERYESLEAFRQATGQERHGREVDYDIFTNAEAPRFNAFNAQNKALGNAYPVYTAEDFDFTLKEGASVIDQGVHLPGINDDYTGEAPDLGAYEFGKEVPHYGPRKSPDALSNTLSYWEKEEGWQLLFDGRSTAGWTGYNLDSITPNWSVVDGELRADGSVGDIVSDIQVADFELLFEWKITKGGNSGVFFHVNEGEHYQKIWETGIEMQVMDNEHNPLGRDPAKGAASLYALYAPSKEVVTKFGEWNASAITVVDGQVTYWLNGEKVTIFELWTEKWYADREKGIHNSRRKPDWGEQKSGRLALQDEGFEVAFRSIKLRRMTAD
ncbi:protein of unknown function [Cyclobacterium xiamenense]|uniref:3-keto-alpha-glucoside-1,2-lyase/3-keto-2-hydroxy-glucal hydratase domain-containing protein n=1 Tax=Cyclobacterium xiamenense TaxID=1297121 RepID=A0A1H7BQT7_9BACT|nr:DUF1080 domain-containing protein [Cyclobacterium xiamenense]SEJ76962.1 protein of unknown function [Cyclobacterium xiamenense]